MQSTDERKVNENNDDFIMNLSDLASVLVKHAGYHEGLYDVSLLLNMAVGQIGPSPDQSLPGAMIGVAGVGLKRVSVKGIHTIDAAVVNPVRKKRQQKTD